MEIARIVVAMARSDCGLRFIESPSRSVFGRESIFFRQPILAAGRLACRGGSGLTGCAFGSFAVLPLSASACLDQCRDDWRTNPIAPWQTLILLDVRLVTVPREPR